MTEKRFESGDLWIQERSMAGTTYFLDEQGEVNALCSRINELYDKCKRLEKENEQLKDKNKALENFVKINFSDMMAEKMKKELKKND